MDCKAFEGRDLGVFVLALMGAAGCTADVGPSDGARCRDDRRQRACVAGSGRGPISAHRVHRPARDRHRRRDQDPHADRFGPPYERNVRHAAPSDIDFSAGDAGSSTAPACATGGYDASVLRVVLRCHHPARHGPRWRRRRGLHRHAGVEQTARAGQVQLPGPVQRVRFHARNTVRDCSPSQVCGGIAGFPCPAGDKGIDDPNDECDPNDHGRADGGALRPCDQTRARPCAAREAPCARSTSKAAPRACRRSVLGGIAAFRCPGVGECNRRPDRRLQPAHRRCRLRRVCVCEQTQTARAAACSILDQDLRLRARTFDPIRARRAVPDRTRCELQPGRATCISNGRQDCGPSICSEGRVCCNFSCGICTEPACSARRACL